MLRWRWIKRISLFFLAALIAGDFFSLFRVLKDPERFERRLAAQIEDTLAARLSLQNSKIIFAPFPALRLENPRLESTTNKFPPLAAERVDFYFRLLPILWGQFKISGFQMRKGEGVFGGIPLNHIDLKVKGLGRKGLASFEGKASGTEGKEVLRGNGGIHFHRGGESGWAGLKLKGDITFNGLRLETNQESGFLKYLPPAWSSSGWRGELHVEKKEGGSVVEGLTRFELKKGKGEAHFLWDLKTESIELERISMKTPFGELQGRGILNVETGEIGEVRLSGQKVVLEELVRRLPAFQSLLPLDTGFSGESEFDLTLQGTWDYLSLHANWNLTPAVLTYGPFFSKPKDFPMGLTCDLLIKNGGSLLSGDFSLRIAQTTLKGALASLDLQTKKGELTILTNKFELKGWESLLKPLAGYELSGAAKVLVNWKGDLSHLERADKMVNLTVDHVSLLSPAGRGIRDANLLLDLSGLSLKMKGTRLEVGGSPLQIEAEVYSLRDQPHGTASVTSPHLDPFALSENLKALRPFFPSPTVQDSWKKIDEWLERFFPKPALFEEAGLKLKFDGGKLVVESLAFQALEGSFLVTGEMDWPSKRPDFWVEAHLEKVSLARYFEGIGQSEKVMDGNLFFKGRFQKTSGNLSGEGKLSITNGDWHSLDLVGSLNALDVFQTKGGAALPGLRETHSTAFNDLKANWKYEKGKFDTDDFLLSSDPLWIEGKGNLSLDGTLNSKLDVSLSPSLTKQVLGSWGARDKAEGKQLGPFLYLLVGNLAKAEVRPDERLMGSFLESIRARRFRKILHEPFKQG